MNIITKFWFASFLCFSLFLQAQNSEKNFPIPKIIVGIVKVSGCVTFPVSDSLHATTKVFISHENLITEKNEEASCIAAADGRFSIDVPIERDNAIVYFHVISGTYDYGWKLIGVCQKTPLTVNVTLVDSISMQLVVSGGMGITTKELFNVDKVLDLFEDYQAQGANYSIMSPEEFLNFSFNKEYKEKLRVSIDAFTFSARMKQFLVNDMTLFFLKGRVIHYKYFVDSSIDFLRSTPYYFPDPTEEPGISYYSFLINQNLNNPLNLYSRFFSIFLRRFLSIRAFRIPVIGDQNVEEWLNGIKNTTKDVLGFDSGLFYDLLVAKAYAIQLKDQVKPFTERQKVNMKIFFEKTNPSILWYLFHENDELSNRLSLHQCDIPNVPNNVLLDSIVGRYKGSVVLVDLWNTWCSPCVKAHEEMQQIKPELSGMGVKFINIADDSSDKTQWDEKIRSIGGEEYFLSKTQMDEILKSHSLVGIPAYLIYNKRGELIYKFVGFKGVENMRGLLLEQLGL